MLALSALTWLPRPAAFAFSTAEGWPFSRSQVQTVEGVPSFGRVVCVQVVPNEARVSVTSRRSVVSCAWYLCDGAWDEKSSRRHEAYAFATASRVRHCPGCKPQNSIERSRRSARAWLNWQKQRARAQS